LHECWHQTTSSNLHFSYGMSLVVPSPLFFFFLSCYSKKTSSLIKPLSTQLVITILLLCLYINLLDFIFFMLFPFLVISWDEKVHFVKLYVFISLFSIFFFSIIREKYLLNDLIMASNFIIYFSDLLFLLLM